MIDKKLFYRLPKSYQKRIRLISSLDIKDIFTIFMLSFILSKFVLIIIYFAAYHLAGCGGVFVIFIFDLFLVICFMVDIIKKENKIE